MHEPKLTDFYKESKDRDKVANKLDDYLHVHAEGDGGDLDARKTGYKEMINRYYDLVTDFYEYGWGQSFHFAPRYAHETFQESIARHQHFLALRLGLRPGHQVMDVGCGVGGPMRSIARFSGANVMGINNNAYQIQKGHEHNKVQRLAHLCDFTKTDFMHLPFEEGTYDRAFAVEATCHAPDKAACFAEVFRTLKPGGEFAGYEWVLTDRYDADNAEHRRVKKGVEEGDALPDIAYAREVDEALVAAGFEVLSSEDRAPYSCPETPWYLPLQGKGHHPREWRQKPVGRWLTNKAVGVLEKVKVAPEGSQAVSTMLEAAAQALVRAGELEIFTPMYFFHGRKPE